jgi:hypothetical protein
MATFKKVLSMTIIKTERVTTSNVNQPVLESIMMLPSEKLI